MIPFIRHTGIAVPYLKDDVNTDQIAPVQAMRSLKPDYKALLFMRARQRDDGSPDPEFVLNRPQFSDPGILVTGHNFGSGSSREAAVWGMLANGIRVIVAKSFADIYRENCLQNGLLPIVLAPDEAEAFIARVVRGRRVADGVIAMVVPGSSSVKRAAEAAGLDRVFRDAGFFWGESGCSMCAGGNGDRGEPGERCVSTTNRNFENRQGPKVRTHLASPETAAATAIAGRIADVSQLAGRA